MNPTVIGTLQSNPQVQKIIAKHEKKSLLVLAQEMSDLLKALHNKGYSLTLHEIGEDCTTVHFLKNEGNPV